jgi:hypothetical protein
VPDFRAKVVRRGQFVAIAKDRRQALWNDSMLRELAGERVRNLEFFQLAVEPVSERGVLMAVAQEGVITGMRLDDVMEFGGRRVGRAVIRRHSGMLGHLTAPIKPATLVNTMR